MTLKNMNIDFYRFKVNCEECARPEPLFDVHYSYYGWRVQKRLDPITRKRVDLDYKEKSLWVFISLFRMTWCLDVMWRKGL